MGQINVPEKMANEIQALYSKIRSSKNMNEISYNLLVFSESSKSIGVNFLTKLLDELGQKIKEL